MPSCYFVRVCASEYECVCFVRLSVRVFKQEVREGVCENVSKAVKKCVYMFAQSFGCV